MSTNDRAIHAAHQRLAGTPNYAEVGRYKDILRAAMLQEAANDNSAAWILAIDELRNETIKKLFNISDAEVLTETDNVAPVPTAA